MRQRAIVVLSTLVLLLAMPGLAQAADFRSRDTVLISPTETVDSDLYAIGSTVRIQGTVRGDVFAAGSIVEVSGTIEGGLNAAGGTVSVTGKVGRGVRLAGGQLEVNGQIGRDLIATGGIMNVGQAAQIGGDTVFTGGVLNVRGITRGSLYGSANDARLEGTVARNVDLNAGRLTIGPAAIVSGTLTYSSSQDAVIAGGARVARNAGRAPAQTAGPEPGVATAIIDALIGALRTFFGLLLLGLLWLWMLPASFRAATSALARAPLPSLGLGLVVLLVTPPLLILLIILALLAGTAGLTFAAAALITAAVAVSGAIVSAALGRQVLRGFRNDTPHDWLALIVGAVILTVLLNIPVLGWVVAGLTIVGGVGGIVLAAWQARDGRHVSPGEIAAA